MSTHRYGAWPSGRMHMEGRRARGGFAGGDLSILAAARDAVRTSRERAEKLALVREQVESGSPVICQTD